MTTTESIDFSLEPSSEIDADANDEIAQILRQRPCTNLDQIAYLEERLKEDLPETVRNEFKRKLAVRQTLAR